MEGKKRNIFPGGNTTEGFFSYYEYILGQKEANRIICLKGGPGVGKSTFMRGIADHFLKKGEDIDLMWCSSDSGSLDGIVLKQRKIAIIDATSPHMVDPINPGAVDSIVHLGEFWDGEALKECKSRVLDSSRKIKNRFAAAYDYLAAAGKLYEMLERTYEEAVEDGELYKIAANIVGQEMSHREIALVPGEMKKYFAGAITPEGMQNHLQSLLDGCEKIYMFAGRPGLSCRRLLNIIAEGAVYRGMNTEAFYCPMKPAEKIEHLLIPELKTAFVSLNVFHDMDPWERTEKVILIDLNDLVNRRRLEESQALIEQAELQLALLLESAVGCIKSAKKEHDHLESYYIPNMDFKKIDELRDEIIGKIEQEVL